MSQLRWTLHSSCTNSKFYQVWLSVAWFSETHVVSPSWLSLFIPTQLTGPWLPVPMFAGLGWHLLFEFQSPGFARCLASGYVHFFSPLAQTCRVISGINQNCEASRSGLATTSTELEFALLAIHRFSKRVHIALMCKHMELKWF